MSDQETEQPVKKTRKPRAPRAFTPLVVQPTYNPPPPNPRIAEAENKIFELMEYRSNCQLRLTQLKGHLSSLQGEIQKATEEFQRVESDIQYRQNMIRQMRGEPPLQIQAAAPSPYSQGQTQFAMPPVAQNPWERPVESAPYQATYPAPPPFAAPNGTVSSYPAINRLYPDVTGGPDGQQIADADGVRQDMRSRGY